MTFKIKDGLRIGTVDVINSSGVMLVKAPTADALTTARTISLGGDLSGSASFNGSQDITITATIAANSVALGTDTTGNYVASITNGSYITGGDGGSEGAGLTLAVDATSANTASKVVARDANGDFAAGIITASLSGNATTATTLQTARTISLGGDLSGSASFNGSADITITATIAANSVALGTDTTGNYAASVAVTAGTGLTITGAAGEGTEYTIAGADATTTTKGVASFSADNFAVTAGAVTIKDGGVSNAELVNSSISVTDGTTASNVSLGGTLTFSAVANETTVTQSGGTVTIGLPDDVTIGNNLIVTGNLTVNGTTTNINTTDLVVEDKNIVLADVATPTDTTADGGGITLKGATDKTFNWVNATDSWTSSENLDLLTGKTFKINGTDVLSASTLGSGVTGSSLTSVGTLTSGVWNATTIGTAYGGTGQTTYTNGQLLIGNTAGGLTKATLTAGNYISITNGDGSITIASGETDHSVMQDSSVTVATISTTNLDTFPIATYRSGKYLIQITQGTDYQMSELRIIHDGTTTYITEYAVLETNGPLGTFTADINGTDARLRVTMASATSATIKVVRHLIKV